MKGWECPRCGYCYGPSTPGCYNCNRPENEKIVTKTGTDFTIKPKCSCSDRVAINPYCPIHNTTVPIAVYEGVADK